MDGLTAIVCHYQSKMELISCIRKEECPSLCGLIFVTDLDKSSSCDNTIDLCLTGNTR